MLCRWTGACLISMLALGIGGCSSGPPPLETISLSLADGGKGLPRGGQWREHFAVADLDGDGAVELLFPPPRKSRGAPVIFKRKAGAWERANQTWPAQGYDYGGIATADVNADGHLDLVLAMHLTGFRALLADAAGGFSIDNRGLPDRTGGADYGSGRAVLAIPARAGEPAAVVLLGEIQPSAPSRDATRAPGLGWYRWTEQGWRGAALGDPATIGTGLAFSADSTCPAKLAVASSQVGAPFLLERGVDGAWNYRDIPALVDTPILISAVALGDFDGDDCADLAVAYSLRQDGAWHSRLDLYRDRGGIFERVILFDGPRDARITALRFAALRPGSPGQALVSSDEQGVLRIHAGHPAQHAPLLEVPAPDWRAGCAGTDIQVIPAATGEAPEIVASFAGEPSMGETRRCLSGGGIQAWQVTRSRR